MMSFAMLNVLSISGMYDLIPEIAIFSIPFRASTLMRAQVKAFPIVFVAATVRSPSLPIPSDTCFSPLRNGWGSKVNPMSSV